MATKAKSIKPPRGGMKQTRKKTEDNGVKIMMYEKGTSGLKSFQNYIAEAYLSNLTYPAVEPTYSRLRRSMPEISVIRTAFTAWGRSIDIEVDLPDEPSDDDKKYGEFVAEVLEDMEGGAGKLIDTIVNNVPFYGWGWWEVVPGMRSQDWKSPDEGDEWRSEYDDGLIGFRRIAFRQPNTFSGWLFDDRKRLLGMKQRDADKPEIELALRDSLHLTYGDPTNPEGLSPLEAVYRLERIRYGLEVILGIGFEHSAGHLKVQKTNEGTVSDDDKALVQKAAYAILSAKEGNFALFPNGLEGDVIDVPFSSAGTLLETIKHYSTMVLACYTMQWIALNTMTGTGSYAAADDSSSLGVFTFNSMMDGFSAQMDEQIGKRLWQWNKSYFPNVTRRPKLRFTNISKTTALTEIGSFLSQLNGILPLGKDDYIAIRKRTGFLPENLPSDADVQDAQNQNITDGNSSDSEDQNSEEGNASLMERLRSSLRNLGGKKKAKINER